VAPYRLTRDFRRVGEALPADVDVEAFVGQLLHCISEAFHSHVVFLGRLRGVVYADVRDLLLQRVFQNVTHSALEYVPVIPADAVVLAFLPKWQKVNLLN
jgi:hypothetical protein